MITIKAHIRHGDYNKIIHATGETVADCINQLAKANTYIPEADWNEYSRAMVSNLEKTGRAQMGWVNYEVAREPAEWQISKHGTPESHPQYGIHDGGQNDFCIVKGDDAKARAELICRAVNSHADLVAALEAVHSTYRTFRDVPKDEQEWTSIDDLAMAQLESALTKAKLQ